MLAPFAGLFALGLAWRYRTFLPLLALVAGALLTAPIWAPIFTEQAYVHVQRDFGQGQAHAVANSIPLDRLLALPAVYDVARDNNDMGDRLGLLQGGMLLIGLVGAVYAWRKRRIHLALAISATTLAGLGLAWMLTASSDPVWRALAADWSACSIARGCSGCKPDSRLSPVVCVWRCCRGSGSGALA